MADQIYGRLVAHLDDMSDAKKLAAPNFRLFDDAAAVLPEYLSKQNPELWGDRLMLMRNLAAGLVDRLPRDHGPEITLLIALFKGWSWTEVYGFGTGNVPFVDGLELGDETMRPYHDLMLALLEKATGTAADAAHVATMREVVQAVVRLWLGTEDAGIAMRAGKLLLDLLAVDQVKVVAAAAAEEGPGVQLVGSGHGLVWKRVFDDRDVYAVMFESCSLDFKRDKLSRNQKTLAQARLMEWLPRVAGMDYAMVTRSHDKYIEKRAGVEEHGLLEFAVLKMVDFKDDVLMYRCLLDFYSELLACASPLVASGLLPASISATMFDASPALHYLIASGVHTRTTAIYLQETAVDPVEGMFLYGPAANYIAVYASRHPQHFLAGQLPKQINHRMNRVFDMSPGKWARADGLKHDLHLLASLPRKAILLNSDVAPDWASSPLSLLPSKSTNPGVLQTLATIFHSSERTVQFPPPLIELDVESDDEEGAAARALYFHYLAHNPRFWADVTAHADVVALKDLALAALACLHAVITAEWSTVPALFLPSSLATPETGAVAILSPPALEYTLPYLLKPPQTFANLVGGRGDTESAAYKVAAAKFDALKALHGRLEQEVQRHPGEGFEEIVATLGKRLAEGPLSRDGEVGGKVATMEL